ncbi:hypothetical protein M2135_000359 [Parabacteroides sp. PF5-9]|nr:hypothetical protein [Parabacteroides sp. PF5-9]
MIAKPNYLLSFAAKQLIVFMFFLSRFILYLTDHIIRL